MAPWRNRLAPNEQIPVTTSRYIHCCLSFRLLHSIWPSDTYLKLLDPGSELEIKILLCFYVYFSLRSEPSIHSHFLFYASLFTHSFLLYLPFILHYFYITSSSCFPAFFCLPPYSLLLLSLSLSLFLSPFSSLHWRLFSSEMRRHVVSLTFRKCSPPPYSGLKMEVVDSYETLVNIWKKLHGFSSRKITNPVLWLTDWLTCTPPPLTLIFSLNSPVNILTKYPVYINFLRSDTSVWPNEQQVIHSITLLRKVG